MEPLQENFCHICLQKHIPSELILFSCTHTFCSKCSPYLLLSCLRSPKQILEKFLQNTENEHEKHDVERIEGLKQNSNEQWQDKLKKLGETCSYIAKLADSSQQRFSQIIDKIIDELQNLKKSNEEKNVGISQSQYKLVQSVLEIVQREANQKICIRISNIK